MTETTEGFDVVLDGIRSARVEREARKATILVELRAVEAELRRLTTAERALAPASEVPETNIDIVKGVMAKIGKGTQAQVAKLIDKPKNTARHALLTLAEQGLVRPTGKLVDRSPEFEWVAAA